MKLDPKDPLAIGLQEVMFVVDANSFEQQCLWEKYSSRLDWQSNNAGIGVEIGRVDGRPVNLSLFTAKLNGHTVLFVDAVSQLVDYKMIDEWLAANCAPTYDNGHRIARTNGMNFHHCLHEVERRSTILLEQSKPALLCHEPD